MRAQHVLMTSVASLVIAVCPLDAQVPINIDLATAKPADTTVRVQGTYVLRVIDQLPSANYQISTSSGFLPVQPIVAQPQGLGQQPECAALKAAVDTLNKARAEEDLPHLLHDAQTRADAAGQGCPTESVLLASVRANTTTDTVAVYTLGPGQYLRVEVTRPAQAILKLTERHWLLIVATAPIGEWHATYGFGAPVYVNGQQRYSARQLGTANSYVIRRDSPTRWIEPVPAVFFSFMTPSGASAAAGKVSFTAGLAADLTNPSIFLGGSWTWHSNLQVAVGASLRQEPSLLGKYSVGDTVQTNLSFDQLTEKVYRVRPFIAVTLRFGKDPFGTFGWLTGASEAKPQQGAKPQGGSTQGSTGNGGSHAPS
jgi:hypothetical protein